MSMLKNQIFSLYEQGASSEDISEALDVSEAVVKVALIGSPLKTLLKTPSSHKEEEDDVSDTEAREMINIVKGIARDDESGVYARLNAAKYVHGTKRGYHRVHNDATLGSEELFLRLNEAYQNASRRARESLFNESFEISQSKSQLEIVQVLETVQNALEEPFNKLKEPTQELPAAQDPGPFSEKKRQLKLS